MSVKTIKDGLTVLFVNSCEQTCRNSLVGGLGKLTQAKTKVFAWRLTGFSLFNFPLKNRP